MLDVVSFVRECPNSATSFFQYSAVLGGHYSVSGGSRGINILSRLHLPVYAEDDLVYAIISKLHLLHPTMLSLLLLVVWRKTQPQLSMWECRRISQLRRSHGFHLLGCCRKNTAVWRRSTISFHSLVVAQLFIIYHSWEREWDQLNLKWTFASKKLVIVFCFFLNGQIYRFCFVFVYCDMPSYTWATPTVKKMLRWPVSTGYSVVKLKNKIGLGDKSEFLWFSNL